MSMALPDVLIIAGQCDGLPEVPDGLREYAEEIKATARDTVCIKLKSASFMKPWQSKVGGEPYLPLTETYPCNPEGEPLMFLAQINFSEMPRLPGYPEKGVLGFFVGSDDLMGLNFDDLTTQTRFRVLYFEDVCEDESKSHKDTRKHKGQVESISCPFSGEGEGYSMRFSRQKQYITIFDYRFKAMPFSEKIGEMQDAPELFVGNGHRVGGYPYFTQQDPRSEGLPDYELLFQLDSDYGEESGVNIMWGDAGVGAFFMRPEDLRNRVFTNVLYSWDCC